MGIIIIRSAFFIFGLSVVSFFLEKKLLEVELEEEKDSVFTLPLPLLLS